MQVTFLSATTLTELQLLGLSFLFSSIVGVERQVQQKSAGLRTHVLVALGATTFTLVSVFGFAGVAGPDVTVDPSRIAAQIVSGVGFLGAGVIFTRQNVVRGLTTAATIWVSAAIGMACGAGMPTLAAAVAVLHLVVASGLAPLVRRLAPDRGPVPVLTVGYLDGGGVLRSVLATASEMGFAVSLLSTRSFRHHDDRPAIAAQLSFSGPQPVSDLVVALTEIDGLLHVERPTQIRTIPTSSSRRHVSDRALACMCPLT